MRWRSLLWICGLLAPCAPGRVALADGDRCFDFTTPTVLKLLDAQRVHRLVIQVSNPGPDASAAAAALARLARRRGLTTVDATSTPGTRGEPEQAEAAMIRGESDAQLLATVRFLTGTKAAASGEFRDETGKLVGQATVWADDDACQVGGPSFAPGSATKKSWYGYELMLGDALALAAVTLPAFFAPSAAVSAMFVGIPVYLFVPGALHASHDQGIGAWASLGIRLMLPLMGVLMASGWAMDICLRDDDDTCAVGPMLVGFGAGMLAAMLIDELGLAWRPVPGQERQQQQAANAAVILGVVPYRGGAACRRCPPTPPG
jgi:hypothetical protein